MQADPNALAYVVVDVETTGGRPGQDRITEIAMYRMEGTEVVDEFHSLVNPERNIPPRIEQLTGINNAMVADAPTFGELIDAIDDFTQEAIFVAHNVNFDYGFLRHEYNRLFKKFQRKKLCTIRLSRKIFAGQASYSLKRLCDALDIRIDNPHRAWADAAATVELFAKLQVADQEGFIGYSLNRNNREASLPPHVDKARFDALPAKTGVYYFHDAHHKIVYIGKAVNIRSRVMSHFSGNTNTNRKHRFTEIIHDVTWEEWGSELIASLAEAHAIKQHWPPFNRALKRIRLNYGVFAYTDRNGYGRFMVAETSKRNKALLSFQTQHEALAALNQLAEEYELCARLSGLESSKQSGECRDVSTGLCKGACIQKEKAKSYQTKYQKALDAFVNRESTYVVTDSGRTATEKAVVLVEQGRYKGFGFLAADASIAGVDDVKPHLTYGYDDQDIQQILEGFVAKYDLDKHVF